MFSSKIKYISFNTFNWQKAGSSKEQIDWICQDLPAKLSINYFALPPDLPVALSELDTLRRYYRELVAQSNGGIIKVETGSFVNYQYIETIMKVPTEAGMYYIGSITIPFSNCSYVIKIQATEGNITGVRDSAIMGKLLSQGSIEISSTQELTGWFEDPYLKDYQEGTLMNLSEKEEYDIEFPEHPLSLIRGKLMEIKKSITFHKKLAALKPFLKR